jgi:hypothetical protein
LQSQLFSDGSSSFLSGGLDDGGVGGGGSSGLGLSLSGGLNSGDGVSDSGGINSLGVVATSGETEHTSDSKGKDNFLHFNLIF